MKGEEKFDFERRKKVNWKNISGNDKEMDTENFKIYYKRKRDCNIVWIKRGRERKRTEERNSQ